MVRPTCSIKVLKLNWFAANMSSHSQVMQKQAQAQNPDICTLKALLSYSQDECERYVSFTRL